MSSQLQSPAHRFRDLLPTVQTRPGPRCQLVTLPLIMLLGVCDQAMPQPVQPLSQRSSPSAAARHFDLRNLSIPEHEIRSGGPPKDGIPAISGPRFVAAASAGLSPQERVIGVAVGDEARAYPLRILTRHEVVNDRVAELPLAVTYCPLCDSSAVFQRRIGNREIEFGVSGLLYNSNVLMYDRNPEGAEGLWSQMGSAAVSGEHAERSLRTVPFDVTSWGDWRQRHPGTQVLSPAHGLRINYDVNPYDMYFRLPRLMFPTVPQAPTGRLPLKTPVLGVWNEAGSRAYPLLEFQNGDSPKNRQILGESSFSLVYDKSANSLRVSEVRGELDYAYSFWFAWYAFHPETAVYEASR